MIAMLWGAGFGLSAVVLFLGIRPPLPDLVEARRRIAVDAEAAAPASERRADLVGRSTSWAVGVLRRFGALRDQVLGDLALLGVDPEAFLAKKLYAAVAGVVLPVPALVAMLAFGVPVPWTVALGLSVVFGLALFFVPDAEVRRAAEEVRVEARQALDVLLGFTATSMAAGDGIESALDGAAAIGAGPAFERFRAAGRAARTARRPVWTAYSEAADELGLPELGELAATISLAGGEGARVAESLTAKAGSLRGRRNADRLAENAATTERMHLPLGVMMIGYLLVIAFPSLDKVLTSF